MKTPWLLGFGASALALGLSVGRADVTTVVHPGSRPEWKPGRYWIASADCPEEFNSEGDFALTEGLKCHVRFEVLESGPSKGPAPILIGIRWKRGDVDDWSGPEESYEVAKAFEEGAETPAPGE